MAVEEGLFDGDARAECRGGNGAVDGLSQANVALDVGQRLQLRRKLLQLRQAPLRRLHASAQIQIYDFTANITTDYYYGLQTARIPFSAGCPCILLYLVQHNM